MVISEMVMVGNGDDLKELFFKVKIFVKFKMLKKLLFKKFEVDNEVNEMIEVEFLKGEEISF